VSRKLAPWIITLAAAAITAVTAAPASAAIIDPAPIGPNQYFSGLVNGQLGSYSAAPEVGVRLDVAGRSFGRCVGLILRVLL
jgi:hypothetical protein